MKQLTKNYWFDNFSLLGAIYFPGVFLIGNILLPTEIKTLLLFPLYGFVYFLDQIAALDSTSNLYFHALMTLAAFSAGGYVLFFLIKKIYQFKKSLFLRFTLIGLLVSIVSYASWFLLVAIAFTCSTALVYPTPVYQNVFSGEIKPIDNCEYVDIGFKRIYTEESPKPALVPVSN